VIVILIVILIVIVLVGYFIHTKPNKQRWSWEMLCCEEAQ